MKGIKRSYNHFSESFEIGNLGNLEAVEQLVSLNSITELRKSSTYYVT
jgi:hypothetical protein